MNNRHALMTAIHRQFSGRIPYTYEARAEADAIFRRHLGLDDDTTVGAHFNCNFFSSFWSAIGGAPSMPERQARLRAAAAPGEQIDIWGCRRVLAETSTGARYYEMVAPPLAHVQSVADVERYDWPTVDEVVFPEVPPDFNLAAWKEDKVVLDMSFMAPFGVPWALLGMEKLMTDLALEPAIVEAVVAKVEAYTMGCLEVVLDRYPGAIDLIGCGDDYGTQLGLLLGKGMIDRYFMPSLARHLAYARKSGVLGYHHCCGAIFDIIPSFIDAGINVLNPIQTAAVGMDPARLKREFGSHLCFHGAIDIQHTLVTGTPDEVRAEVRSRIDTLGPAGYILAPSHTLQPDTPPENIVAMYEEVQAYPARLAADSM